MDVKEKILDAIQMLASNSVKKAGYDKTIQAQIVSCEDATIGKYRCRYQDSTFYAYTNNSDLSFSKGSYVYILVPGNDFSKEKTILGTTDKLGINYISQAEGDQAYEQVGTNCIDFNDIYYLNSNNKNYKYILYKYNGANVSPTIDSRLENKINFTALDQYIKESSSLIAGATFKTNIPAARQSRGHYGIAFDLVFTDNASGQQVIRSYEINEDNMIDNPYRLAYKTRQYQIFEIDGANFERIDSIAIFNRDFPDADGNVTTGYLSSGDIEITELELTGAIRLSESQINGVAITFYTPYGTFFTDSSSNTDEKMITAQVKVKGKLVSSVQKIPFYWGRENVKITPSSELYNKHLGRGWQCLNDKNVIQKGTETVNPVVEWVAGGDTFYVKREDAKAQNNKYKVAVIYDNTVITKQINIKNLGATAPEITITSSTGATNFYYDMGHPTLTCSVRVKENGQTVDKTNNCIFHWAYESNTGVFNELPETTSQNSAYQNLISRKQNIENNIAAGTAFANAKKDELNEIQANLNSYNYIQRVQGNKVYDVQIKNITNFGTFKCSVFNAQDQTDYYGTASITLTNTYDGENLYSLVINNGTATFQYNEDGIAPTSESLDVPQKLQALSFTIYDNLGQPIDQDIITRAIANPKDDCQIQWGYPIKDTLLEQKTNQNGQPNGKIDPTGQYHYYKNHLTLSYGIKKKYDISKKVNQITLNVKYKGMNLTTETQFNFVKQGEPGTNGTQYIVKLVPNTNANKIPLYPMVTKVKSSEKVYLNYRIGSQEEGQQEIGVGIGHDYQFFKAQLWHNGDLVWEGKSSNDAARDGITKPTAVHWEILRNKYKPDIYDNSVFGVSTATSGYFYYEGDQLEQNFLTPYANVVKCTITWQDKFYYGTIPITTAWVKNQNYRVSLKNYTGFRYVIYTSDGMTPQYDNSHPFEFICEEKMSNDIWEDVSTVAGDHSIEYSFNSCGNIYTKVNDSMSYRNEALLQALNQDYYRDDLENNQIRYRPKSRYDGQCVNVAALCQYIQDGSVIGKINVPIHFLLNKYGLANINQWDGNSVQVNQQGGYILAPQMGAGTKDNNNNFTGVLMGQVKVADKNHPDVGLLGYADGERTFFLNSNNGSAIFGKAGIGQIIIDPNTTPDTITYTDQNEEEQKVTINRNRAMLYSSNFWKDYNSDTGLPLNYGNGNVNTPRGVTVNINPEIDPQDPPRGMLIDLTTPQIAFANGKFFVNQEGHLTAKGGGQIAGWRIDDNFLRAHDLSITMRSTTETITEDNQMNTLPPAIYTYWHNVLDSTKTGSYFGADGLSIGSLFKVTNTGVLRLGRGATASPVYNENTEEWEETGKHWIIDAGIGSSANSYIAYNTTTFANDVINPIDSSQWGQGYATRSSVYLGTNGLSLGNQFSVTNEGAMSIIRGKIDMKTKADIWQIELENDGITPKIDTNGDIIVKTISGGKTLFKVDNTNEKSDLQINVRNGSINLGNKFIVAPNGRMQATSGKIGGFFIGSKYLANPSSVQTFQAASSSSTNPPTSVYLGTDGISLGKDFSVDNTGEMRIRRGSIALGENSSNTPPWNFYVDTQGNMTARSGEIGGIKIFSGELLAGQRENDVLTWGFSLQKTGYFLSGPKGNRFMILGGKTTDNNQTGDLIGYLYDEHNNLQQVGFRIQPGPGTAKFRTVQAATAIDFTNRLTGYSSLSFGESRATQLGTKVFQVDPVNGQVGIASNGGIHGYPAGHLWNENAGTDGEGNPRDLQTFWISADTGEGHFKKLNADKYGIINTYSGIHGYSSEALTTQTFWISAADGKSHFSEVNTPSITGLVNLSASGTISAATLEGTTVNGRNIYAIASNGSGGTINADVSINAPSVLEGGHPIVARFG